MVKLILINGIEIHVKGHLWKGSAERSVKLLRKQKAVTRTTFAQKDKSVPVKWDAIREYQPTAVLVAVLVQMDTNPGYCMNYLVSNASIKTIRIDFFLLLQNSLCNHQLQYFSTK